MKKNLYFSLFIFINLLLSSNVIWVIGYITSLYLIIAPSQPVPQIFVLLLIILLLILAVAKFFLFPLIYFFFEKTFTTNNPFSIFLKNDTNAFFTLFLAFLLDLIFIILWSGFLSSVIMFYILSFGGVFICYLSLVVWFKVKRQNREVDDRNDRQICD